MICRVLRCRHIAFVAGWALLTGCGSDLATLEGVIRLDDEPLADARIVLQSPDRPMAVGKSDEQGRYSVQTGSQPGVLPGEYAVTISAYETRQSGGGEAPVPILRSPRRYNSADTSGLSVVVQEGANTGVDFDLSSSAE